MTPLNPAQRSFEAKLKVLESAVARGSIPSHVPKIATLSDFRGWEDHSRDITSWENTSILNKSGPYSDLRTRLDAIWPQLLSLQKIRKTAPANRSDEKAREQRMQVASLTRQVFELTIERDALRSDLLRAEQQVVSLRNQYDRLLATSKKIVPFGLK